MLARLKETPLCPHCGQTMPRFPELGSLHLTPSETIIYERVRKAGRDGILPTRLISALYDNRQDGGPEYAMVALRVFVSLLNKKLRPLGYRLQSYRGLGNGYRLENIGDVVSKR